MQTFFDVSKHWKLQWQGFLPPAAKSNHSLVPGRNPGLTPGQPQNHLPNLYCRRPRHRLRHQYQRHRLCQEDSLLLMLPPRQPTLLRLLLWKWLL